MPAANPIPTNNAARFLESCRPRDGRRTDVFSDPRTPTLKLRVTAGGSRTWYLWSTRKVGGRRKTVTVRLGDAAEMSIGEARDECRRRSGELVGDSDAAEKLSVYATAAEAARHYLDKRGRSAKLRPSTRRIYESYARSYWGPLVDRPLRRLDADSLNSAFRTRASRSRSDALNAFHFLRAVYRYWRRQTGASTADAFAQVVDDWGGKGEARQKVLTDDALAALHLRTLRWQGSPLYPLLIRWLLLTGCRVGESLALRWSNVGTDVVMLDADTTKMGRVHAVPVSPALQAVVLEPLLARRSYYDDSPFVFPSERTDSHMKVSKRLRSALHGLPGGPYCIHDLRRTVATAATELGYELPLLKALLSHASSGGAGGATAAYVKVGARKRGEMLAEVQQSMLSKLGLAHPA